jgi:hypothetical protein
VQHSLPDDALVFYSPTVIRPFGYYAGYYSDEAAVGQVPPPLYPSLYWLGYSATRFNPDYEAITADVSKHKRAWLLAGYARDKPRRVQKRRLIAALKHECERVADRWFRASVTLFPGCKP